MKFYLYPMKKIPIRIKWDYDKYFYKKWVLDSYNSLLLNEHRTNEPNKADFFIVSFTLQCLSFVGFNSEYIHKQLQQLPYWNNGNNHIVFDLTDSSKSFYKNKNLSIFKSAFSSIYYNSVKDVSIPQFPRYLLSDKLISNYKKDKLVTFKGNLRPTFNKIRSKLLELNNDTDIIVKSFSNDPTEFEFKIKNDLEIIVSNNRFSYLNLLLTSRFSILPKGNGHALSYRHLEAMNVKSIPIIISDNYILPFNELIDWNSCSIIILEKDIDNLIEIINQNLYREDELRNNVSYYYNKYLSSNKKIIDTSINIFINKLTTLV